MYIERIKNNITFVFRVFLELLVICETYKVNIWNVNIYLMNGGNELPKLILLSKIFCFRVNVFYRVLMDSLLYSLYQKLYKYVF